MDAGNEPARGAGAAEQPVGGPLGERRRHGALQAGQVGPREGELVAAERLAVAGEVGVVAQDLLGLGELVGALRGVGEQHVPVADGVAEVAARLGPVERLGHCVLVRDCQHDHGDDPELGVIGRDHGGGHAVAEPRLDVLREVDAGVVALEQRLEEGPTQVARTLGVDLGEFVEQRHQRCLLAERRVQVDLREGEGLVGEHVLGLRAAAGQEGGDGVPGTAQHQDAGNDSADDERPLGPLRGRRCRWLGGRPWLRGGVVLGAGGLGRRGVLRAARCVLRARAVLRTAAVLRAAAGGPRSPSAVGSAGGVGVRPVGGRQGHGEGSRVQVNVIVSECFGENDASLSPTGPIWPGPGENRTLSTGRWRRPREWA
jgi:hypothetical protein